MESPGAGAFSCAICFWAAGVRKCLPGGHALVRPVPPLRPPLSPPRGYQLLPRSPIPYLAQGCAAAAFSAVAARATRYELSAPSACPPCFRARQQGQWLRARQRCRLGKPPASSSQLLCALPFCLHLMRWERAPSALPSRGTSVYPLSLSPDLHWPAAGGRPRRQEAEAGPEASPALALPLQQQQQQLQ